MDKYKITVLHSTKSSLTIESGEIFNFNIHSHTYYELTMYEPFDGNISINDQAIPLDTRTAILIAPYDFHKSFVNGYSHSEYIKIAFTPDMILEDKAPKTSLVLQNIAGADFIVKLYQEIIENKDNKEYLKSLLNTAVCIMLQKGEEILPSKSRSGIQFGIEAVKIINESFNDSLTLSSVAKKLYITPQYLSKTFKEDIGITFSEYLTRVRLSRAAKLLIETNESITKICEICGYRDFSHFLRSFKKTYGISPSEYRKNQKQIM